MLKIVFKMYYYGKKLVLLLQKPQASAQYDARFVKCRSYVVAVHRLYALHEKNAAIIKKTVIYHQKTIL